MKPLFFALGLLLALPATAWPQTRVLVVPSGESVVVPPRSAGGPLPRAPVVARRRLPPRDDAVAMGTVSDRSGVSPVLLLLPLVAAAALAATLATANEAGGNSGPVRTR